MAHRVCGQLTRGAAEQDAEEEAEEEAEAAEEVMKAVEQRQGHEQEEDRPQEGQAQPEAQHVEQEGGAGELPEGGHGAAAAEAHAEQDELPEGWEEGEEGELPAGWAAAPSMSSPGEVQGRPPSPALPP